MNNPHKPAILPVRASLQDLEPRAHRQATALDEIRSMHDDLQQMAEKLSAAYRDIDAQQNMIELLKAELAKAQDAEKTYRRKLIRLAAHQEQYGKVGEFLTSLAAASAGVMRDAREVDEVAAEREAAGGKG